VKRLLLLILILLFAAPAFAQQFPTPGYGPDDIDVPRALKALIPNGGTEGWFATYTVYDSVEGLENASPDTLRRYLQREFGIRVDNLFEDMRAPQESALLAIEQCDPRLMTQAMQEFDFKIDQVKERLDHADYVLKAIGEQLRFLDQEKNLYFVGEESTQEDNSTRGYTRDPRDSFFIAIKYPSYWSDWANSTVPSWRQEKFSQAVTQHIIFAKWRDEMLDVQRYLQNGLKIAQENRNRLHTSFNRNACQECR